MKNLGAALVLLALLLPVIAIGSIIANKTVIKKDFTQKVLPLKDSSVLSH